MWCAMHKKLEDLLCLRYPKLFASWSDSPSQGPYQEKFACGDGWFDLIETLCIDLQFRTDHAQAPQIRITEIKTKSGTLRFNFLGRGDDYARGMRHMALAISELICEECGATRCEKHYPSKQAKNILGS